jgi:hypothetical protein
MSVVVPYPVEVKQYQVSIGQQAAFIQLEGVEVQLLKDHHSEQKLRRVAHLTFDDSNPANAADFITRGGFLNMHRPIGLLSGILDLLRHEQPLFLNQDGVLSTLAEPAGEGEAD